MNVKKILLFSLLFCLCASSSKAHALEVVSSSPFIRYDIEPKYESAIMKRVCKSPRLLRNSWNYCADTIVFRDTNYKEGEAKYSRDFGISVNLKSDSENTPKYCDFFHELGHHVAYVVSSVAVNDGSRSVSDTYKSAKYNKTLTEMLKYEGNRYIRKLSRKTKSRKKAWKKLKKELRRYNAVYSNEVSDIWDGVSNGKAFAYGGHSLYGGKTSYWSTISVGCEAFAEMYEASIVNKRGLKLIRKYFPRSYNIFIEELRLLDKQ